jgi:hypothetical protein
MAFGSVTGMGYLTTGINYAFWTIATVGPDHLTTDV